MSGAAIGGFPAFLFLRIVQHPVLIFESMRVFVGEHERVSESSVFLQFLFRGFGLNFLSPLCGGDAHFFGIAVVEAGDLVHEQFCVSVFEFRIGWEHVQPNH